MIKVVLQTNQIEINKSATSKGNQPKWYQDGYWYKADNFGYESLSEYVCSKLMGYSNFKNYVDYELCEIVYNDKTYRGCRSKSYNEKGYDIIPLERFIRQQSTMGLASIMSKMSNVDAKIKYVSEFVNKNTNITDLNSYLSDLLLLDALFLNEDRHTNNIVMIRDVDKDEWQMSPVFDLGAALFSDTRSDYPLEYDLDRCYEKIKAKPFSEDFDEQLDAAEKIQKSEIKFKLSENVVEKIIDTILAEVPTKADINNSTFYSDEEIKRVKNVVLRQFRKYSYLIDKS